LGLSIENPRDKRLAETLPPYKKQPFNYLMADSILAKAYLVMDTKTEKILLAKAVDTKLPIASLTKLLTALTAYEYLDPMANYLIPPINERYQVKPYLNLKPQSSVNFMDLFKGALICSANDAAESLALLTENLTHQKFTDLMNQKAKQLGMVNSNFSNPVGFDSEYNYSTAEDLLKLAKASQEIYAIKQLGKHRTVSFMSMENNQYVCKTSNRLILENSHFENIKTGWTEQSNGSMLVKAKDQNREILIVLLNSPDRDEDVKRLSTLAFTQFVWDLEN
jgi:D-alanyl-D-alanine carboxypeptidase (penicillin-binding protein 5/6)